MNKKHLKKFFQTSLQTTVDSSWMYKIEERILISIDIDIFTILYNFCQFL